MNQKNLSFALIGLNEVSVEQSRDEWDEFEQSLFERIRASITLDVIKDDPLFRSYRNLYWGEFEFEGSQ